MPMLKLSCFLLLSALPLLACLGSCSREPTPDQRFVGLANRYLDRARALDPEWATELGDHRFDGQLTDRSQEAIAERAAFDRAYLDSLGDIPQEKLSQDNSIDLQILHDAIELRLLEMTEIKPQDWNPLYYNVGDAVYRLLARDFAPLEERLESVRSRLEAVPDVVAAARTNLHNPPRIHTETAIRQNQGTVNLIMDGLQPFLDQEPALRDELAPARSAAIAALEGYGRWLEDEVLPSADGDFRLGSDLYRRKLRLTLQSRLRPIEIRHSAEIDLRKTHEAMYHTALALHRQIWPGERPPLDNMKLIRKVLDRLAEDHPDNETIVALAQKDLDKATEFVRKQDLVSLPDEPIRLIVMPEFQRGVAVAYCDAPGPLEEHGETFYSIAPTPADWSQERVESFFREYNDYMLQDLTVHEAMPGHYLQLAHANRFQAPTLVRAIFASGTFVEGWATYAEQIMVDAGFGGPEVKLQQLKMRLRLIINALLDQGIHAGQMTREEAMRLMMEEGFQEEGEAAGKWRRACMSSTQLSTYYVGNLEVNQLRRDYEAQAPVFKPREFHDALLAHGSPAPRYLRQLMGLAKNG
jgi:uncharacterized protein (DUF885 family)